MSNSRWTGLIFLLFSLMVGTAQAQTCHPESIPASTPDSQMQDNGDGTVTDTKTGLMWKQCSEGQSGSDCASGSAVSLTWQQALQRAKDVNDGAGFVGHHDWRLPNINELSSLVEYRCKNPAINLTRFPNTGSDWVWSSSAAVNDVRLAWIVISSNGRATLNFWFGPSQLRLVRSAP